MAINFGTRTAGRVISPVARAALQHPQHPAGVIFNRRPPQPVLTAPHNPGFGRGRVR